MNTWSSHVNDGQNSSGKRAEISVVENKRDGDKTFSLFCVCVRCEKGVYSYVSAYVHKGDCDYDLISITFPMNNRYTRKSLSYQMAIQHSNLKARTNGKHTRTFAITPLGLTRCQVKHSSNCFFVDWYLAMTKTGAQIFSQLIFIRMEDGEKFLFCFVCERREERRPGGGLNNNTYYMSIRVACGHDFKHLSKWIPNEKYAINVWNLIQN